MFASGSLTEPSRSQHRLRRCPNGRSSTRRPPCRDLPRLHSGALKLPRLLALQPKGAQKHVEGPRCDYERHVAARIEDFFDRTDLDCGVATLGEKKREDRLNYSFLPVFFGHVCVVYVEVSGTNWQTATMKRRSGQGRRRSLRSSASLWAWRPLGGQQEPQRPQGPEKRRVLNPFCLERRPCAAILRCLKGVLWSSEVVEASCWHQDDCPTSAG